MREYVMAHAVRRSPPPTKATMPAALVFDRDWLFHMILIMQTEIIKSLPLAVTYVKLLLLCEGLP